MSIRSTAIEFGVKVAAAAQTKETLLPAAFGRQVYEAQIDLDGDPEVLDPVGHHARPLRTRKSLMSAKVSFSQALTSGGADGTAPSFYDLLRASGFTVGTGANADVATMGAMPDNTSALVCELFDGLQKRYAYGVRGLTEIVGDKVGEKILCKLNGFGHGDIEDDATWPVGIVDDNTAPALFEGNSLTIGGWTPELRKCSFKMEKDPVKIENALSSDGFVEPWLVKPQAFLRIEVYQHALSASSWYKKVRDLENNNLSCVWEIPLDHGLKLGIAGSVMLVKTPNRTEADGIGTLPLEFQFDRTSDITITQSLNP